MMTLLTRLDRWYTMCQTSARSSVPRAGRAQRLMTACDGASLVEITIVAAIAAVLAATTVPAIRTAMRDATGNAGMRQAQGALREAHESAMTRRRTIMVVFTAPGTIQTFHMEGAVAVALSTTMITGGMQYMAPPAGIPDTPDGFGLGPGLAFGGLTTIYFLADGSVTDENGVPVSGTVFLGMTGQTMVRAVTVLGPSGRVQSYRWDGRAWQQ
jgi:type II secretory pathway pseudopilin PulG